MKLLVALAFWVGALGLVLAFAQDELPPNGVLTRVTPDDGRRPPRAPTFGNRTESQSCVVSTRNAVRLHVCVSPQTARVGEPVTIEVRSADFGRDCGGISLDFGDGSAGPARTTEHRYERPGSYTIRLVGGTCPSDVRLRVTVRP